MVVDSNAVVIPTSRCGARPVNGPSTTPRWWHPHARSRCADPIVVVPGLPGERRRYEIADERPQRFPPGCFCACVLRPVNQSLRLDLLCALHLPTGTMSASSRPER